MLKSPGSACCCMPARERVGLTCDPDVRLECGGLKCAQLRKTKPARLPALLASLLAQFPPHLLYVQARHGDYVAAFLSAAACYCAALPTREERRLYFDFLSHYLSPREVDQLRALHSAEWYRLRGKSE